MLCRIAAGHAQLARSDVLNQEGERRREQRGAPLDPHAVRPDTAAHLRSAGHKVPERGDIRVEVVGQQSEVGGFALRRRQLPPAMVSPALRVAEADELDVRPVGPDDERVVRHTVRVNAAGDDVEASPHRIRACELRVEIPVDLDDVVEHPEHGSGLAPRYRPVVGRRAVDLLRAELDAAYAFIRTRVEGLTDDEFFWEPVAGCWTVRQDERGKWAADYPELPHPDPPPFTTIGWRLVHVSECKLMYHEYAFGPAKLTFPDIDSAHMAKDAIAQLEQGHAVLQRDLAALDDAGLEREVLTNWGEKWPAWRIFWTMIEHDLHHGGEIGALRDLYREKFQ